MGQITETRITPQLTYQVQAFFRAALNMNDTQTVRKLLKHQREAIDIELTNQEGVLPIHLCAIEGNKPMISILLRAGADIDAIDRRGWTCLHAAVHTGNLELCQYLLRKGADPLVYSTKQELPVDLSNYSVITYLLVEVMQQKGQIGLARFHLSRAVAQQKYEVAQQQQEEQKNEVFKTNRRYSQPAVYRQHTSQQSSSILKRRPSQISETVSGNDETRCSWSSTVSDESETGSVRSSSSSSSTSSGLSVQFPTNTLFLNYVHENEHELLDQLLNEHKVGIINKLDRKGLSSIHWAAMHGFDECIRVLVKHGANVDIEDPNGWTALHAAVITEKTECVRQLLKCDSRIYAVTNSGETVFDMTNNQEIKSLLEGHVHSNLKMKLKNSTL
ncbi:protein phosphatase 1 regulatory subunit 12B-like [Clytia hemisphaerica]|uniref:ANK_REP_REGION domain-containing protein n=1 Tax=Clytia hemisphaerica TaxID=252671 RepID=A0A7M6DK65_9CNID